jgi:AI-2 transport protein TqsA
MAERSITPLRGLLAIVLSLALVVLVGFLLFAGKSLLIPIFVAVISVYVLVAASEAITRLPGGSALPEWFRRMLVLALFLVAALMLGSVMIATAEQISRRLPEYSDNVTKLITALYLGLGFDHPDLTKLWQRIVEAFPLQRLAGIALGQISAMAGLLFMVVVYATFLMSERNGFARKIRVALPGERGARASQIVERVNSAISDYLAVKTLVNVILAVMSYAVLWVMGVDFALFWAILIGLLNYIPYVGSLLGVVFPVALSVAQFGSVGTTLLLAALLTAAQMWVGNSLEPKMVGKKVNMSPFVVLVALSVWSSLWGTAGAILAIPMTSIIAIVMASFQATRPFAVLLAEDVGVFEDDNEPVA